VIEGLLGRKIGMTQIFNSVGEVIPVTVIEAGPCVVTQLRTQDRDGYEAVNLGARTGGRIALMLVRHRQTIRQQSRTLKGRHHRALQSIWASARLAC